MDAGKRQRAGKSLPQAHHGQRGRGIHPHADEGCAGGISDVPVRPARRRAGQGREWKHDAGAHDHHHPPLPRRYRL